MKIRLALGGVAILALGVLGWAVGQYLGQSPVTAQVQTPPVPPREPMILPAPPDGNVLHLPPTPLPPTPDRMAPKASVPAPVWAEPKGSARRTESASSSEITPVTSRVMDEAATEEATGKIEPCVTLQWIGPPTTKLGQPANYQ